MREYDPDSINTVAGIVTAYLDHQIERASSIDGRATAVLGFGGGVAVALVPWLMGKDASGDWPSTIGFLTAIGAAVCSVVTAFVALRVDRTWKRLRDVELFPRLPKDGATKADLQTHWVALVHDLLARYRDKCDARAEALLFAQGFLVASIVLAGVTFALRAAFASAPGA